MSSDLMDRPAPGRAAGDEDPGRSEASGAGIAGPPAEPRDSSPGTRGLTESDVLQSILSEHEAIRGQMVFEMGRASQLATFAVVAAAAVLTFATGLEPILRLSVAFGVVAALAITTLAYIGVVGEQIQEAHYLRDQGDFVRSRLAPFLPEDYRGRDGATVPPVLAWEEQTARRSTAPLWIRMTSSLSALEVGVTPLMAGFVLIWAGGTYLADPGLRTIATTTLFVGDLVVVAVAVVAVVLLLRLQRAQARDAA